jgi:hypothetical protein
MYAYGYKNLEQAYYTLAASGMSGIPCNSCGVCQVNCAANFQIKEKIRDISRLKDVPMDFLMA